MTRRKTLLTLGVVFGLLFAPLAASAGNGCRAGNLSDLVSKETSGLVTAAYKDYSPAARKGVAAVLWAEPAARQLNPQVLEDILYLFDHNVVHDFNPLGTDQGLFEAIAGMTDTVNGQLTMRDGLVDTIKDLANQGASEDVVSLYKGAAFDLLVARERGYGTIAALQHRVDLPPPYDSMWRKIDVVEKCPGNCGGLPGILHEDKNWETPLVGSFDGRLTTLADQFKRDIVIHQGTDFDFYRLNLRTTVQHQKDMIRDRLVVEFSDPDVVRMVGGSQNADRLRTAFLEKWDSPETLDPLVSFR
jgi:hypothetical protein